MHQALGHAARPLLIACSWPRTAWLTTGGGEPNGWFLAVVGAAFVAAGIVWRHQGGLGLLIPFTILGTLLVLVGLMLIAVASASAAQEHKIAKVAATGLAGTAIITVVEPTGVSINDNPRWRITVNVSPAAASRDRRWQATLRAAGGHRVPGRPAAASQGSAPAGKDRPRRAPSGSPRLASRSHLAETIRRWPVPLARAVLTTIGRSQESSRHDHGEMTAGVRVVDRR